MAEALPCRGAAHPTSSSSEAPFSDAERVDLAAAVLDVQLLTTTYQAALAAPTRAVQPSLMEFLR
jgi:flagellar hook-associated protein 3 FlgL